MAGGTVSAVMEEINMQAASVMDAFAEGMRAGKLLLSPSLNPFADMSCPEHMAWERGRFAAVSIRLAGEIA
jgi:hypothetical protein